MNNVADSGGDGVVCEAGKGFDTPSTALGVSVVERERLCVFEVRETGWDICVCGFVQDGNGNGNGVIRVILGVGIFVLVGWFASWSRQEWEDEGEPHHLCAEETGEEKQSKPSPQKTAP